MTTDTGTDDLDFDSLEDDGADAFMEDITGLKKKPGPTHEDEPEPKEEGAEEPEEAETEVEGEKTEEPEETAEADPNDPEVELTVGDKTEKVKLSALKALYSDRESISTRSAAVEAERVQAQEKTNRATTALTAMVEKAKARFAPYEKLDYLTLSRDLDRATFDQLRKEAVEAQADVAFFETELTATLKAANDAQAASTREQAGRCLAVLTGPVEKGGIAGWDEKLYGDILAWADKTGLKQARSIVEPSAILMMHKAMLYDNGVKASAAKVAAAKSVATKVMRPAPSGSRNTETSKTNDALARLRRSGSQDDAALAFMESFGSSDD